MSSTKTLLTSLALLIAPAIGCRERSNTVEQNQDIRPGGGTGAGEPMGSAAMAPTAGDNPMSDAGGTGSGSGAAGTGAPPSR
jgi:hypothetical protein